MAMHRYIRNLLLPVLLVVSPAVWAERPSALLVGLHIQSQRLELQYAVAVRETDVNSLDLLWDEPLNSWLEGSVKLSVLDVTQSSNPIPAGQSLSGNALGLGLRLHLYRGERLKLSADLDYQYADTTADLSGQSVDMRWQQLSGQLQADIRLVQYTYLTLAVGAVSVDGDEHATGTITSVQSFSSERSGFGRLGIQIGVDPTSHIGIEVNTGSIGGGRISFQRWF
jgi:hypothetical protein